MNENKKELSYRIILLIICLLIRIMKNERIKKRVK